MITGAIFDVDGTLLDTMPMWEHASENYLRSIGVTPEENLAEKLYTYTMERAAIYMKETYHLDMTTEAIVQGVNETIHSFYKNEAKPRDGVVELVKALYECGVPLVIATSTDRHHIEATLKRLDLAKYFTAIFTCSEVGVGKVKPDIYLQAANAAGSPVQSTWVFEDAYHAAQTAAAAGFPVVGIYDKASHAHQQELKDCSKIYIKEFSELHMEDLT